MCLSLVCTSYVVYFLDNSGGGLQDKYVNFGDLYITLR